MPIKVLGIVPARQGSKGFPNKNIKKINGKTLIEKAIKVALDCKQINDVYISTDSAKYENLALIAGAKSIGLRPKKLGLDNTKMIDVIVDLLNKIEIKYDYVVLLQPSSPIRSSIDIKKCINLVKNKNLSSCVSVARCEEPHPYKLKKINKSGYLESFISGASSEVPRQSLPKVYALNGAIYVAKVELILNNKTFFSKDTMPYIMKDKINIDNEEDFIFLKTLIDKGKLDL